MSDNTYPEHEKLQRVKAEVDAVTEFIETGGFVLAQYPEKEERLVPTHRSASTIALEYFEIDQKTIEAERRAMLTAIQNP